MTKSFIFAAAMAASTIIAPATPTLADGRNWKDQTLTWSGIAHPTNGSKWEVSYFGKNKVWGGNGSDGIIRSFREGDVVSPSGGYAPWTSNLDPGENGVLFLARWKGDAGCWAFKPRGVVSRCTPSQDQKVPK